ncbi:hypothetical protein FPV67DRAFT_1665315 [Lyophyllum atratum]|nr:hypothetical protein FPV67DRAFT_1665315 [Lyophyllum atratum]
MFKLQLEFIGLFKAIEIILKKYTEFDYWERFTRKRQMQTDLDTFVQEIKQQLASYDKHDIYHQFIAAVVERKALEAVFRQARIDDAQADAILMNDAAGTLRLYTAQSIPALSKEGNISKSSTGQIMEKLRTDEPGVQEEDPLVTEAREELLKALSEYKGVYLRRGIDSGKLTLLTGKPVHFGVNSKVCKGLMKGCLVAIELLTQGANAEAVEFQPPFSRLNGGWLVVG